VFEESGEYRSAYCETQPINRRWPDYTPDRLSDDYVVV
jgi:hypothetical protein